MEAVEKEVVIERCKNDLAYFVEVVLEGRANKEPIVMKLFNALLDSKPPESAGSEPTRESHDASIFGDTTDFNGIAVNMEPLLGDEPSEKLSTKQPRETLRGISVRKKNTE